MITVNLDTKNEEINSATTVWLKGNGLAKIGWCDTFLHDISGNNGMLCSYILNGQKI